MVTRSGMNPRGSTARLAIGAAAALAACGSPRPLAGGSTETCTTCHGDAARPPTAANPALPAAPPFAADGSSDTGARGVGAHLSHLLDGPLRLAVACSECHVVPTTPASPGHLDGGAILTFGPLATASGSAPSWNGRAASCSSVYCHGATLASGASTSPIWTRVDGTQAACGTCHGLPPDTGQHVFHVVSMSRDCSICHPPDYVALAAPQTVDPALHVNGVKDLSLLGWNPDATKLGSTTQRGTSAGCHGGTRYWYVTSGSCY